MERSAKHERTAPLLISGPSGVGKDYLGHFLVRNHNCRKILSTTSRKSRPNEIDGREYKFVSEEEFLMLKKQHEFLLSTKMFGAWYGYEYSAVTNASTGGSTPLGIVHPKTVHEFKRAFPFSQAIYLIPSDLALLSRRMLLRGDNVSSIDQRIDEAIEQLVMFDSYYHKDFEDCIEVNEDNFNQIVNAIRTKYISNFRRVEVRF